MIRFLGATLIVACVALAYMLYEHVQVPALHQISPGELFLALGIVVTGFPGAMMLVIGEKLFAPPE